MNRVKKDTQLYTRDEITLRALKNEHARLVKASEKAKADVDDYMTSGQESFAIYTELGGLIEKRCTPQGMKRLEELKKRQDRLDRIRRKDLVSLLDVQFNAEQERDLALETMEHLQVLMRLSRPH